MLIYVIIIKKGGFYAKYYYPRFIAKAVYDEISDHKLKEIIKEFPREYIIGSNGPDFLFFYKFFQKKYASVRQLGSKVHASHVNDFYDLALDLIQHEKDEVLKKP